MKKITLVLVFLAAFSTGLFAEFDQDDLNLVTFVNSTKNTIEFIFLSPGDSEYWGPEILGSERVLESGDSLGFFILYPNACDDFDIMAIDDEGNTAIIYDYPICDDSEEVVEIVGKDMRDDAPDMDFVTIEVENDTGYDVWYVFISPSDSQMWGVDYLDEETIIADGDTVSFIFPADVDATEYDLQAVDEDMDTYTFSFDVDLSSDDYTFAIEASDLD